MIAFYRQGELDSSRIGIHCLPQYCGRISSGFTYTISQERSRGIPFSETPWGSLGPSAPD